MCLAVVSFSRRGLTVRTADSKSARVGSTPTASAISFYNLLQLNNLQSIINSFLDAHSKLMIKRKFHVATFIDVLLSYIASSTSNHAGVAQLVEFQISNLAVASSSLVVRSISVNTDFVNFNYHRLGIRRAILMPWICGLRKTLYKRSEVKFTASMR